MVSFLFLASSIPASARQNVKDWYIKDFQVDIIVNTDSSLTITEKILADCGNASGKHGIFRVFSTINKTRDGDFITPIDIISITDENGKNLKYQKYQEMGIITYKIGDPLVEVKGENTYVIKYVLKGVVNNLTSEQDELYFDILGSFWDLEIDNFRANLIFPEGVASSNAEVNLYSGKLDSGGNDLASFTWLSGNNLEITSTDVISKREGITLSVVFPTKILNLYQPIMADKAGINHAPYPSFAEAIKKSSKDIALTILLIFLSFLIWFKYGRDPKSNFPIIAEFESPDNLTPLEISLILNEAASRNDAMTATIINLAVKGYLKIEKIDKKMFFFSNDYKLISSNKEARDLYRYENYILEALFKNGPEIKLSELRKNFAPHVKDLGIKIYTDLRRRGLIDKHSLWFQIGMIAVGLLLIIISFGGLVFLAGISFIVFGIFMRRLTPQGSEIKRRIKGFKLYLETAEKYRARFYEQENMMEKLLPYAILFNLTSGWLKKMEAIYGEEYFRNHQLSFMTGVVALSDFKSFSSTVSAIASSVSSHVASSSSGSSGGGSVGGGGGGGGGGGW